MIKKTTVTPAAIVICLGILIIILAFKNIKPTKTQNNLITPDTSQNNTVLNKQNNKNIIEKQLPINKKHIKKQKNKIDNIDLKKRKPNTVKHFNQQPKNNALPELEKLALDFKTPKNIISKTTSPLIVNYNKTFDLAWETKHKTNHTVEIINNNGNTILYAKTNKNRYRVTRRLEKGDYFWKLKNTKTNELLFCGKITITNQ